MTKLRARTVFSDEKLTVTVVESLEIRADRANGRRTVTVNLEPTAIVVREPGGTCALDMSGQPMDIARLDLPGDFLSE